MNSVLQAFIPNKTVSKSTVKLIVFTQITIFLLIWYFSPFVLLPSISETYTAFLEQWQAGLGNELITSLIANCQATVIAAGISLLLAYGTVLEALRPLVLFLSKLRFLSMIGLSFAFTVMTNSQHQLKISMLVFSICVFFITGMADVVSSIPKEQYDLARTLRMGPWRIVWEVIVLGQIDKAFDVLRQNAAIGWMMLTMIESMTRSDGGIGALLTTQNKHFHLSAVLAIQITILLLGLGQDWFIGFVKQILCPYASLEMERK